MTHYLHLPAPSTAYAVPLPHGWGRQVGNARGPPLPASRGRQVLVQAGSAAPLYWRRSRPPSPSEPSAPSEPSEPSRPKGVSKKKRPCFQRAPPSFTIYHSQFTILTMTGGKRTADSRFTVSLFHCFTFPLSHYLLGCLLSSYIFLSISMMSSSISIMGAVRMAMPRAMLRF